MARHTESCLRYGKSGNCPACIEINKKIQEKKKKTALNKAFIELGAIDKNHEAKKITKKQHDSKSKAVLKRLMK